jgi:hypothetical protein
VKFAINPELEAALFDPSARLAMEPAESGSLCLPQTADGWGRWARGDARRIARQMAPRDRLPEPPEVLLHATAGAPHRVTAGVSFVWPVSGESMLPVVSLRYGPGAVTAARGHPRWR